MRDERSGMALDEPARRPRTTHESELTREVRRGARRALDAVSEEVEDGVRATRRAVGAVGDEISGGMHAARRAVRHASWRAEDLADEAAVRVRRAPLRTIGATLGAALGAGLLLGWIAGRQSRSSSTIADMRRNCSRRRAG